MKKTFMKSSWTWYVFLAVSIFSVSPVVLTALGVSFGSASRGGAGAHFAGWVTSTHVVRIDVNVLAMLLLIGAFAHVYQRIRPTSMIAIFGITIVLFGLAEAIQIVPTFMEPVNGLGYETAVIWTTSIGRFTSSCLVLMGLLFLGLMYWRGKGHFLAWTAFVGLGVCLGSWYFMASARTDLFLSAQQMQVATLVMNAMVMILLYIHSRKIELSFRAPFTLIAMIPYIASHLWLLTSVETIYDPGFHVVSTLKWHGWLLLTAGLGIDLVSTYHHRELSQEKQFLRGVIDTIPHFIFARDQKGNFTLVNQAIAQFYKISKAGISEPFTWMRSSARLGSMRTWKSSRPNKQRKFPKRVPMTLTVTRCGSRPSSAR